LLSSPAPATHRHLPSFPTRRSSDLPATTDKAEVTGITLAPTKRIFVSVYNAAASRTLLYLSEDDAATWTNIFTFNDYISKLAARSEEHTSELQSRSDLVCRLLLEKK